MSFNLQTSTIQNTTFQSQKIIPITVAITRSNNFTISTAAILTVLKSQTAKKAKTISPFVLHCHRRWVRRRADSKVEIQIQKPFISWGRKIIDNWFLSIFLILQGGIGGK